MRRLLPLALAGALVCSLAGQAEGTRVAGAPTLVVDNSFALDTSDPQRAYDYTSVIVDRAIYDTLFTFKGGDLTEPVPLLVQSWTSSGARTFTFRLRREVHFADGTPLTAADVVFSLRRLVNLKGSPAYFLSGIGISAKDRYTVVMRSKTPEPQLPSILTSPSTGIVNAKLVEAHGGTDAPDASTADRAEPWFNSSASAGAGSGPYVLESYDPASQVALVPNARYWGKRRPAFGEVVIRNMAAATQLLNIQRGSHEVALDLSSAQAQTLHKDGRLRVTLQPSPWTFYVFMNDDPKISPVTSNNRFQQAVRYALDPEDLLSLAGPGAIRAPGIIASMIPGALPQKDAVKRDLARTKTELAASGVATQHVTLEYPSDETINGVPFATLAQRVQAQLQAAGFDLTLAGSPVATFQPKFRSGRVAFGIWVYAPSYPDPADYSPFMPGNLIADHFGWGTGSDPPIEKLAAKALVTTEPAARRALYRQIQREMNARSPLAPLIQPSQVFARTSDLSGAVFSGAYGLDITRVTPS